MLRQRSASASSFIASQPPMLARPSFLADMVMPSASAAISRTMSGIALVAVARLALLDEPGVLGEAARVEEERQAVAVAHLAHGPQVGHRDRLAAHRVVGHGHEHDRDVLAPRSLDQPLQRVDVHVALERRASRAGRGPAMTVDRLGASELDVGARGVEMGVVGDDLARAADDREEDLFRRPALVGRDDVLEREELLDGLEEAVPRR